MLVINLKFDLVASFVHLIDRRKENSGRILITSCIFLFKCRFKFSCNKIIKRLKYLKFTKTFPRSFENLNMFKFLSRFYTEKRPYVNS